MKTNTSQDDISRMLASIYDEDAQEDTPPPNTEQPLNEYDVYVESDRITFVRKEDPGEAPATTTIVERKTVSATPEPAKPLLDTRESTRLAYVTVIFYLFLIVFSLIVQLQIAANPPTATITIVAKSQQIIISGTLKLGRVLRPTTVSQQQTVRTTGHGHQPARAAKGSITFYNGQLSPRFVPAGTILTGTDGVAIETTQDTTIPAADTTTTPPTFGQMTVSAQAVNEGTTGNIAAYDISQPYQSVIAKNLEAFTGGQDERYFQIVTKADIDTPAAILKAAVVQSMPGTLQGELTNSENLQMLPCSPTVIADHQAGEEAPTVTVIVSLTCSAVAYNETTLRTKVSQLQTAQAIKKLGAGYTLVGDFQVSIKQATVTPDTPTVFLSFSSTGTFVYTLNSQVQERIKSLVSGKSKSTALQILNSLPGIRSATINGVDQNTPLPKDQRNIHIIVIYAV